MALKFTNGFLPLARPAGTKHSDPCERESLTEEGTLMNLVELGINAQYGYHTIAAIAVLINFISHKYNF